MIAFKWEFERDPEVNKADTGGPKTVENATSVPDAGSAGVWQYDSSSSEIKPLNAISMCVNMVYDARIVEDRPPAS